MSAGGMIAVSILLGRAMGPVELAIGSWRQLGNAKAAYDRLTRLLAAFPEPPARMELPPPTGRIRVDQLAVVPPGAAQPAVRSVSFALEPGEVLAVVGPSASGKSSLARALVGIWPAAVGSVRLDDADVGQWSRDALGPHLGYLPQDIELFDGTVAENIARFGPLDAAQVIEAAQAAGIHEMILHFPKGYDTVLGPGGFGLSGGQKQRIGLARALFGRPALLVLDEPNSNLDEAGEAALVRAVASLKAGGSTVVLITHRPSVLGVVDRLLLMKQGVQQIFGPKDEVLKALLAPVGRLAPAPAPNAEAAA
jgi:ATP-binding cassette subfamily C exporter for protease/lipase